MAKKGQIGTLYGVHVDKEKTAIVEDIYMKSDNLKVNVQEEVKTEEKLHNWKKWFNGAKRFWSIKTLPPRR